MFVEEVHAQFKSSCPIPEYTLPSRIDVQTQPFTMDEKRREEGRRCYCFSCQRLHTSIVCVSVCVCVFGPGVRVEEVNTQLSSLSVPVELTPLR